MTDKKNSHFFEKFYFNQDIPLTEKTKHFHTLGLQFQIYSPVRLRMLLDKDTPWYIKEDTPKEILALAQKAPSLSDEEIDFELNKYYIHKAIRVMSAYKNGSIPLTSQPHVKTTPQNLLSKVGEECLTHLMNATKKNDYSLDNREIALFSTHKFLLDTRFYCDFDINPQILLHSFMMIEGELTGVKQYIFPTIQLTRGCYNECSHCMASATAKNINHMPYPMFLKIYETLLPHYKDLPMYTQDTSFGKHFDDSDPLHYQDNIIGADYGDIVTLLAQKYDMPSVILTRGVKGKQSKIAFAKILDQGISSFPISFVDTPKEDMAYNLKQLKDTLQIVNSMTVDEKERDFLKRMLYVSHLHLNSGPTITKETLDSLAFPLEDRYSKAPIYAVGRARQFPESELYYPWKGLKYNPFMSPFIIRPNGEVVFGKVDLKNGEYSQVVFGNIFDKKSPVSKHPNIFKLIWAVFKTRQNS